MPGRDLTGSANPSYSANLALFKSHKPLPRPHLQTVEKQHPPSWRLEGGRTSAERQQLSESSERIKSWIPEPSPAHAAPDHDLPLTPPMISMNHEVDSWNDDPALARYIPIANALRTDAGTVTPLIQQSPPTPETTPPRAHGGIQAQALFPVSRDPSLRADSFETARENLPSDDEDSPVESPSLRPARQSRLRSSGKQPLTEIGLGLGLEWEDEDPTPTAMTPQQFPEKDGFTGANGPDGALQTRVSRFEDDEIHGPVSTSSRRKSLRSHTHRSSHPPPRTLNVGDDVGAGMVRSQRLRQRIEGNQPEPRRSMEKFAEEINWPLTEEDFDIDAQLLEMDDRRFSQISATSTVVEALVIDTKPQRQRTLRHSSKVSNLKSESSQATRSNRSSMISNSAPRRRLPRSADSPDPGMRTSVATDASGSINSNPGKAPQDAIPVMVIPPRRSSL